MLWIVYYWDWIVRILLLILMVKEVRNHQWCWKTSGQNLKYFSNDVMCHTVLMCYNVGKHYLRYIFWKQCTSLSLQVWGECNTKYFIHSKLSIHWLIYNGCEVSICPLLSILCMKKLTVRRQTRSHKRRSFQRTWSQNKRDSYCVWCSS